MQERRKSARLKR